MRKKRSMVKDKKLHGDANCKSSESNSKNFGKKKKVVPRQKRGKDEHQGQTMPSGGDWGKRKGGSTKSPALKRGREAMDKGPAWTTGKSPSSRCSEREVLSVTCFDLKKKEQFKKAESYHRNAKFSFGREKGQSQIPKAIKGPRQLAGT